MKNEHQQIPSKRTEERNEENLYETLFILFVLRAKWLQTSPPLLPSGRRRKKRTQQHQRWMWTNTNIFITFCEFFSVTRFHTPPHRYINTHKTISYFLIFGPTLLHHPPFKSSPEGFLLNFCIHIFITYCLCVCACLRVYAKLQRYVRIMIFYQHFNGIDAVRSRACTYKHTSTHCRHTLI